MALNAKEDRMVFWFGDTHVLSQIVGVYPHNGATFYEKMLPDGFIVHTMHFTEDDQFIVVNSGEDTQLIIPLKPLPEFMEQCNKMFFMDWMPEEEKYAMISQYNGKR